MYTHLYVLSVVNFVLIFSQTVCDDESLDEKGDRFCYYVGICMAPLPQFSGAAIMQIKKNGEKWKERRGEGKSRR